MDTGAGIGVVLLFCQVIKSLSNFLFLIHIQILGPQKDHSETHDDPYVLVSAAHCNYICKDRIRGDVLETCCCRPPDSVGSCAANSKIVSKNSIIVTFYFDTNYYLNFFLH